MPTVARGSITFHLADPGRRPAGHHAALAPPRLTCRPGSVAEDAIGRERQLDEARRRGHRHVKRRRDCRLGRATLLDIPRHVEAAPPAASASTCSRRLPVPIPFPASSVSGPHPAPSPAMNTSTSCPASSALLRPAARGQPGSGSPAPVAIERAVGSSDPPHDRRSGDRPPSVSYHPQALFNGHTRSGRGAAW